MNNNKRKPSPRRRAIGRSRRRTSMDSFLFHLCKTCLFTNPFLLILKFLHVVLPVLILVLQTILASLVACFTKETSSIPQSSCSLKILVLDPEWCFLIHQHNSWRTISVQSRLHTFFLSPMGSLNLFDPQQSIMEHLNPPILSPITQNPPSLLSSQQSPPVLSPVQQVLQTPPPFQKNPVLSSFWSNCFLRPAKILCRFFLSSTNSWYWYHLIIQSGFINYLLRWGCALQLQSPSTGN